MNKFFLFLTFTSFLFSENLDPAFHSIKELKKENSELSFCKKKHFPEIYLSPIQKGRPLDKYLSNKRYEPSIPGEKSFPIEKQKLKFQPSTEIPIFALPPGPPHTKSEMGQSYSISSELYPDFSVGNANWAKDITGSFAYFMQAYKTSLVFHEKTGSGEPLLKMVHAHIPPIAFSSPRLLTVSAFRPLTLEVPNNLLAGLSKSLEPKFHSAEIPCDFSLSLVADYTLKGKQIPNYYPEETPTIQTMPLEIAPLSHSLTLSTQNLVFETHLSIKIGPPCMNPWELHKPLAFYFMPKFLRSSQLAHDTTFTKALHPKITFKNLPSSSLFSTALPPQIREKTPFNNIPITFQNADELALNLSTPRTIYPDVHFQKLVVSTPKSKVLSKQFYHEEFAHKENRSFRLTGYDLTQLPKPDELKTDSFSDEFKVHVKVIPQMTQKGYIFTINILPVDQEGFKPLPQNVIFLLDQGASIEKYRFDTFKAAITQSLNQLDENTSFNIISFDQQAYALSDSLLRATTASKKLAKQYLTKATQKKHSAFPVLFQVLDDLKKQATASQELYTLVVLSNGHLMKNIRIHREALGDLIKDAPDNLSIFTAAISDNNNVGMLELLAKLGKGEFFHSQTNASFPRKLSVHMKRLNKPIANNIQITNLSPKVKIFQNKNYAPILFADKLYTFYGITDSLDDINLIIQGYRNERFININKKISLQDSRRGSSAYEKEIAFHRAFNHIIDFLQTNDHNDLYQAQALLHPFDYPFPAP